MNVIFELIRVGIRAIGIKIESLSNNTEEFTTVSYDECSGFQMVKGFNITERESFLLVSKDYFFKDYEDIDLPLDTSECNEEIKKGEKEAVLNDNENILKQLKLYDFKSIPAHVHDNEGAITCSTPTKYSCNASYLSKIEKEGLFDGKSEPYSKNSINTEQKESDLTDYEDYLSDYIQDSCVTRNFLDSQYKQNCVNNQIYFTPDELNFYDKIRLNDDFKKSDILLLLRLKRKKLAMLESQLKRDLKLLDSSESDTESQLIYNDSLDKITRCPAQLYFIKRRIDNTKEKIENTEIDIAMLEEKASEAY